tara:strand:+ start:705 stop:1193 length:489 start_codon:yes stop_codon:yes gene_type:complete
MAKKTSKKFKMPDPIFDEQSYTIFEAIIVNEYRKITFDKSNPKMADDRKFPKYKSKSYENKKKANLLKRQDGSYSNSRAPVVSGDLMLDTDSSFSVEENSIYIGWSAHAKKLDWLRDGGRILTSKQYPINPKVIDEVLPAINAELEKRMPKGKHTITIGKKK